MSEDLVRPRIGTGENAIEPIVMKATYKLPFNRQSSQTVCGANIQNQVGGLNWRVTIDGILTKPQFYRLADLSDQERVTVITEEFGKMSIMFDQLNVERVDGEDVGHIDRNDYTGALLGFQLQTKEENNDDGEGNVFFNRTDRRATSGGE